MCVCEFCKDLADVFSLAFGGMCLKFAVTGFIFVTFFLFQGLVVKSNGRKSLCKSAITDWVAYTHTHTHMRAHIYVYIYIYIYIYITKYIHFWSPLLTVSWRTYNCQTETDSHKSNIGHFLYIVNSFIILLLTSISHEYKQMVCLWSLTDS